MSTSVSKKLEAARYAIRDTLGNLLNTLIRQYARCVSHALKECVGYHTITKIFVCGTLEFSKIAHWNSEKWVWDDAGGGCNVTVPNLPRREVG